MQRRREFIAVGLTAAGALALGPGNWSRALAGPFVRANSPYGPLGPPDENGLTLPDGFSSRVIAQGSTPVPGTTYQWHVLSDGAATYRTDDGGWILVSNSEVPDGGGASAIRFDSGGQIVDAYRILSGTSSNCAGGRTPWGTWLSCEEVEDGLVWECDPTGDEQAIERPALGVFRHEAVAVDTRRGHLYLSEDRDDGAFYRFTPDSQEDLGDGLLEVARVGRRGRVRWVEVSDPSADSEPTRDQVEGATRFRRGEGVWYDRDVVYLATTNDNRIWAYNTKAQRISVLYDGSKVRNGSTPLANPDNITVSRSGDLFVADNSSDGTPFDICILTPSGRIARFLAVTGPEHGDTDSDTRGSECTGVVFDPSGQRMYFSSQRAYGTGVIYEVEGPFRR